MEEEKKVSEEKQVKVPNVNPYHKYRGEDDAEVEAFAKGELAKYQREQREKEAIAATEQKDTDASEETAEPKDQKATPIAERPAKAEDRVFKKRYDDLKRHYDSTINKHKEEVNSLRPVRAGASSCGCNGGCAANCHVTAGRTRTGC